MVSVYDRFRTTAATLFDRFEAATGTITSTVQLPVTKADRAAGKTNTATETRNLRVLLGKKKTNGANGIVKVDLVARLDGPAEDGDRLTVAGRSYTVTEVEEIGPPNGGVPILWLVVLT